MFTAGAVSLLRQAREIQDEELQKFCSRVSKLLQEDPGAEAVDSLQRLFLIISATKYSRRLDETCLGLLQATLCLPSCPEQLQVLCAAVLREGAPCHRLALSCDSTQDARLLSLVASVLLAQGRQDEVRRVARRVLELLGGRQPEGPSLRHLLPVVSKVVRLAPGVLHEDQAALLSRRLADWLRHASVQPGPTPSLGGFFSTPRARQPGPITEVDGAVATDFFTVLSTAQRCTEDQRLHVQAFSMLRTWLVLGGPARPDTPDSDERSELEGSTTSVLSTAPAASRLLPPQEWLREKAFEYCQRLIEQSNRRALRKGDADLQKACLVEAVLVLDQLCRQEPTFLYRTLSSLKALHGRLRGDPAHAQALLPIAQFFLNHSEAAAVDSDAICQHLLTWVPAELFHCPMLAFELVQFCRDNLHFLSRTPSLLGQSFPNLLKLLAWHSPALTADFLALLPALVDTRTAVEMLQALLDLPCLTAALDLQLGSSQGAAERPLWDASPRTTGCLEGFRDPQFQGLFQYLLRARAGGATKRLAPLHQLLQPMASCARVAHCAQAVPTLLQGFFAVAAQFVDGALADQLVLLLLERSNSLFPVPGYEAQVHRVMSSQLLALCRLRPALVVDLARELLDFVGSVGSVCSKESVFTSVVWAIGEYLSGAYNRRCTVEQINRLFEALEALLFELTQARPSAALPRCPPRVAAVLMTTLTKLASRSQDLIPRCLPGSRDGAIPPQGQRTRGLSAAVKAEGPEPGRALQGGRGCRAHASHGAAEPAQDAQRGPVRTLARRGGLLSPLPPGHNHGPAPGPAHGQPAGGEGGCLPGPWLLRLLSDGMRKDRPVPDVWPSAGWREQRRPPDPSQSCPTYRSLQGMSAATGFPAPQFLGCVTEKWGLCSSTLPPGRCHDEGLVHR
ncbi:AP-5 complex subunit zeta-1 isoform X3 [Choloepus didactylus]|uniref:AP-5 complex subunit zeta-1 isoform X3 n=1 Tax=Choloepus didactylus TaxID=27675 RepID=UPI00189F5C87|nr:AP-5 complex subunit zeta-1 isoform X3 [Choloepus didactylus]